MFEKIRVLVVDDSAFMRKFISDVINSESDMKVIDTAKDGREAIEKVRESRPDVITMDVEMPHKNGLEALEEIMRINECFQVIMLSGLTAQGSSITVEALAKGAFDFVQKPSGFNYLKIDHIKDELVEKIRYAVVRKKKLQQNNKDINESSKMFIKDVKIEAIALGASTGGPRVLYDVITHFPKDLNVPVFVVQHMPAGFTKAFAQRLDINSPLSVMEAKDGEPINPGKVYIAPGGYHMLVEGERIKLDTSPPIHGVRPAVDKLFISAAERYEKNLLCCVFTGMGKDGAAGVKEIKARGGIVLAQDEATSIVYGMPKAAFDTGCVDMVLPDYKIAEEIVRLTLQH
ncbi:MAG: two-component system, chemotaxis family, protein-glutamate methylesterase/glutaminase [Thermoanaerobacteraceae bacterium]|jgi:two-component system chemotaxis response regulator CheB|nr:two-component system, chemotaxis family, protein-glutamate methylesterase/glutaminase [Thermoanaerobacteraceae bacterium]